MERLLFSVLSMSATAAVIILLLLPVRLLLRKAPRSFSYALWAVVLLRLLCPFSIPTPWSLTPTVQIEPAQEGMDLVTIDVQQAELTIRVEDFSMGGPAAAGPSTPDLSGFPASGGARPERAAPGVLHTASLVWLSGVILLLGYSAASLFLLKRKLTGSIPLEGVNRVRLADHIPSPFVLGLVFPTIYLPSGLPEAERDYILLHERTHIRRGDHIFRALAWLALAIHWFNPLVWLSFHLAGTDMEMSCDEAVLRSMGRDVRADYSASLLRLSVGGGFPAGPLAFGGGDPRGRIKHILNYKKPARWVLAAALIAVLGAGTALATHPGGTTGPKTPADSLHTADLSADLSVSTGGDGELAQISGFVGDFQLEAGTVYKDGDPWGRLFLPYPPLDSGGVEGMAEAWWDDLDRTSVTVSTAPMALLSGQNPSSYYVFTAALTEEGGTVTELRLIGSGPSYPASISEAEALRLARIADRVMRAARSSISETGKSLPPDHEDLQAVPFYFLDGGYVRVGGIGNAIVTWGSGAADSGSRGSLYFARNPDYYCPRLAGEEVEGGAHWLDEETFRINFNVNDERAPGGTISGFRVEFLVDMDSGTVVERDFQSLVEGETLELTDQEMVDMARSLVRLMDQARSYWFSLMD